MERKLQPKLNTQIYQEACDWFVEFRAGQIDAARLKALGAGVASHQPPPRGDWNLTPFFESPFESDDSKGTSAELDSESDHPLEIRSDTHSLDERDRVAAIGRDLAASGLIPGRTSRPRFRRFRTTLGFATAVTLLLTLAAGGYLWFQPSGDHYSTPVGGLASVPLQDGSHITLNTATEVHVALSGRERDIELTRGEAFFEVAHDKTRPFVVNAGNRRVIAVGTQFSVLRDGDNVRVVVSEGTVRIEDRPGIASAPALPLTAAGSADAVLLSAGSVAHAGSAGVPHSSALSPQHFPPPSPRGGQGLPSLPGSLIRRLIAIFQALHDAYPQHLSQQLKYFCKNH